MRSIVPASELESFLLSMKHPVLRSMVLGSVGLSLLLSSCVVDPYGYHSGFGRPVGYGGPAEGSVAGAVLGAAAGGIIGNQSGRGLEGAALGGVLGALAGGALQNGRQQRWGQPCYQPPVPCAQPTFFAPQPAFHGCHDPYAFGGW